VLTTLHTTDIASSVAMLTVLSCGAAADDSQEIAAALTRSGADMMRRSQAGGAAAELLVLQFRRVQHIRRKRSSAAQ
jgi:hypothetical protein